MSPQIIMDGVGPYQIEGIGDGDHYLSGYEDHLYVNHNKA